MDLNQILIDKSKTEIIRLKKQRKRMCSELTNIKTEYKRKGFQQRIESLDKKIDMAETALDKYMNHGTGRIILERFTGYWIEQPNFHIHTKQNAPSIVKTSQALYDNRKNTEENRKRREKLIENLLCGGVLITVFLIFAFVSWKLIEFFSDTIFGTDYEFGITTYINLLIYIIVTVIK